MAFAASLDSSLDHKDVVRIRSEGIHAEYICARRAVAFCADCEAREPINTRSGCSKSFIADPYVRKLKKHTSARNSGFERISK
jgi:hypothetical protein